MSYVAHTSDVLSRLYIFFLWKVYGQKLWLSDGGITQRRCPKDVYSDHDKLEWHRASCYTFTLLQSWAEFDFVWEGHVPDTRSYRWNPTYCNHQQHFHSLWSFISYTRFGSWCLIMTIWITFVSICMTLLRTGGTEVAWHSIASTSHTWYKCRICRCY